MIQEYHCNNCGQKFEEPDGPFYYGMNGQSYYRCPLCCSSNFEVYSTTEPDGTLHEVKA